MMHRFSPRRSPFSGVSAALLMLAADAAAQNPNSHPDDHNWSNRFALPGLSGPSPIVTTPDRLYGAAIRHLPSPGQTLYGFRAYNLCIWDGSGWQVTGPGAFSYGGGFPTSPFAIAVEGGEVYVGGNFEVIDGQPFSRVARSLSE